MAFQMWMSQVRKTAERNCIRLLQVSPSSLAYYIHKFIRQYMDFIIFCMVTFKKWILRSLRAMLLQEQICLRLDQTGR